jgi:methyl-accepting chemotaxis protein
MTLSNATSNIDYALSEPQQSTSNNADNNNFQQALNNLQYIVQTHSRSHRAVANRVRMLIRVLIIGLVSALAFILYLLYLLTMQINVFSDALDHITMEADAVQTSLDHIEMSMTVFDAYMTNIPEMHIAIGEIDHSLDNMTQNVYGVTNDVQLLSYELGQLQYSLKSVSTHVQTLDQALLTVKDDVNDAAKPFRRFNQFIPF